MIGLMSLESSAMNESDLNWEDWNQQKIEARQKLLALPPEEAQKVVESILYTD